MFWRFRSSTARIQHVKGLARAAAYVTGLGVVLGALQIRAARAEMSDRTVQIGRQMMTLAKAATHDQNKISINGQTMWLGNTISHDTTTNILDRYQAYCEGNAAQTPGAWSDIVKEQQKQPSAQRRWTPSGVIRGGDSREGSVVCFTKTPKSKQSVSDAVKTFAETGDLGHLGAARYVYAKTTEQGNTHVLTAWTDDTFSIFDLVGQEDKDVAGADFGYDIPRVSSSRRVLSARLEGTPFGVNVYMNKEEPKAIAEAFDGHLQRAGWTAVDPELERRGERDEVVGRVYEKDNVVLTLATARASKDDPTFTTLGLAGVQTGSTGKDMAAASGARPQVTKELTSQITSQPITNQSIVSSASSGDETPPAPPSPPSR